jgi:hypothetical protein
LVPVVGSYGHWSSDNHVYHEARADSRHELFCPRADIIHVELPPITVGDEVRVSNRTEVGKVLAIDVSEGLAWVKWGPRDYGSEALADLRLVPQPMVDDPDATLNVVPLAEEPPAPRVPELKKSKA